MTETKRHTNREHIDFFQSRLDTLSPETAVKYRRTISELDLFLTHHSLQLADLNPTMIADWACHLLRKGLSKSTVTRHLNILSTLAHSSARQGLTTSTDAPRALARRLADTTLPPLINEHTFKLCLDRLRHTITHTSTATHTSDDLLLYSLLNGPLDIDRTATLRKKDISIETLDEISRHIVERNIHPTRLYIFDLRQSYRTPRQIRAKIAEDLSKTHHYITTPNNRPIDPDHLIRSIWAALAIHSGATPSQALGCLQGQAPYTIPAFVHTDPRAAHTLPDWNNAIHTLLTPQAPRWYAIHLRRGTDINEIRHEITTHIHPAPQLFYPVETLSQRTGPRNTTRHQPILTNTAFIRTNPENITPLLARIGHKAWCYRTTPSPTSPYATIPPTQMRRFQAAIGIFTPDNHLHPLGHLTPRPGETVIIIRAGYADRHAQVEEIINPHSPTAIIRLRLTTEQGYEWRINADPREIQRILS